MLSARSAALQHVISSLCPCNETCPHARIILCCKAQQLSSISPLLHSARLWCWCQAQQGCCAGERADTADDGDVTG